MLSGPMLNYLLREWSRWCRDLSGIGPEQPACKSAESAYRSPQIWRPPEPRPPEVVEPRAWRTEKAVHGLGQPYSHLIRIEWVYYPDWSEVDPERLLERRRRAARMPLWAYLRDRDTAVDNLRRNLSFDN